jgi:hypothetical protein
MIVKDTDDFTKKNVFRKSTARLFIIVGNTPNEAENGKDLIIQAVDTMGALHAGIIPKYTSRTKKTDDGNEIVCDCSFFELENGIFEVENKSGGKKICDIVYNRNGNYYGFDSKAIWNGLKRGMFQVVVVSEADTINKLKEKFGGLVVLAYVHSHNMEKNNNERRIEEEFKLFSNNFTSFSHVLIYEDNAEDLYDQIFRLFRAYEKGLVS